MKHIIHKLSLLLILSAVVAVTGCETTGRGSSSNDEWRLASLERAFQEYEERERADKAELEARSAALEKRVAGLEAAWEAQGFPSDRRKAPDNAPEVKLAPGALEEADITEQQAFQESLGRPAKPMAPMPEAEMIKAAAPSDALPTRKNVKTPSGPMALYKRALDLTRKGEVVQGRELFQEFLDSYPEHRYVPNALYWLGETWYREGDFPQAILVFKDVPARFSDHTKAAAALLKMGYSYEKLGDLENAKFYLRNLLEVYPKSEPAKLARNRLQALGP